MTLPEPDGLVDAAAVVDDAMSRLAAAVRDRRHPMHAPVVATSTDSGPDQRVMVLRGLEDRTLRFHTDIRSGKVSAIAACADVHVLAYDAVQKVQLRLSGQARIARDGATADAAWASATAFARRCYLAEPGPGTAVPRPASGLPPSLERTEPDAATLAGGRANFAVLLATIDRIDWLYLAHTGHRRAVATMTLDGWTATWVIP